MIQLKTEFVSGLVVPAVVAVELGLYGCLFDLSIFQTFVDGIDGGLDTI